MSTQPAKTGPDPVAPAGRDVMRAIVQDVYGSADRLRLSEIEKPAIAVGEVLVQVRAAGVDRGTCHLMRGEPYLMRILGFGFRGPKNRVPGLDVAGTIVGVGADVTRFRPGDEVFGIARGSFAEYAAAREDKLVRKPARLSFEQAAVVAVSGLAAIKGLHTGRIAAGQKVLIIGASGGVGTYAVQLAKAFGAKVTGVASTGKVDLVRSIGADEVIDYTREDFADGRQHYDLILDIGGSSRLSRLRRALTPKGTLVIAGSEGARWTGVGRQLRALVLSLAVPQRLTTYVSSTNKRQADLEELRQQIEAGHLTPIVGKMYRLADVPEAIRHLEGGRAQGKIAISV
jgi:NADPH:quinone reductase-like Zn-dependent oxidoreductase